MIRVKSGQNGPRVKFFGFRWINPLRVSRDWGHVGIQFHGHLQPRNNTLVHPHYRVRTKFPFSPPPLPLHTNSPAPPPSIHTVIYWGHPKFISSYIGIFITQRHVLFLLVLFLKSPCSIIFSSFSFSAMRRKRSRDR